MKPFGAQPSSTEIDKNRQIILDYTLDSNDNGDALDNNKIR